MPMARRTRSRGALVAVTAALLGAGWAATMGTSCGGSGSAPACFDDGAGSCRAWRDCQPGSYVGEEGTATTDRVCAICPAGTVSTTLNAVGCTSWDRCVPGEQVGTGATGDRRCQACPSGWFSTTFDAASCTAWQSCAPGTFVADPPSSREDRECKPCAAGTYSSGVDRSACLPEDVCPAGTVRRGGGCEPCPAGQHCAGGDAPGVECTEGSWDDDGNPATACVPQTSCSPGFLVAGDGSATEDRSCASCAGGSYSATMNAGTCLPWSSCQAGRHVAAAGTNVTNRACEDCAPGTFSASADAPACAPWTPCAPGSYVTTAGTSTADQACSACTGGLVCDGACLVGAACCTAAQCEDGDACTTDSCDAASHQCGHAAAGDGARTDRLLGLLRRPGACRDLLRGGRLRPLVRLRGHADGLRGAAGGPALPEPDRVLDRGQLQDLQRLEQLRGVGADLHRHPGRDLLGADGAGVHGGRGLLGPGELLHRPPLRLLAHRPADPRRRVGEARRAGAGRGRQGESPPPAGRPIPPRLFAPRPPRASRRAGRERPSRPGPGGGRWRAARPRQRGPARPR